MLDNKTILITGGTGSFGNKFTERVFAEYGPRKVIIYSRDEYKQYEMRRMFLEYDEHIRYFIGDVRDRERLLRACDGVDYIIHAAALKQVPACEYNPFEAIKTNIYGAQNVVDAAIDCGVERVVALSTDKAVNPINLYGATKLASDKLFVAANAYVGFKNTCFSVVRYGNVAGSRGSVIPFFKRLVAEGVKELPVTDKRMTRFWITLDEAVDLVFTALDQSKGGETYISKIPSFNIVDVVKAMAPGKEIREIGIREGEKLHELMVTEYDGINTFDYGSYYVIYPQFDWWDREAHFTEGGKPMGEFFRYASDENDEWLSIEQLREHIEALDNKA